MTSEQPQKPTPIITSDIPLGIEKKTLAERIAEADKTFGFDKAAPQEKTYKPFAYFCDNPDDFATPEKLRGFRTARVSQWLAENEHFKTDIKSGILFYGDSEKGVWLREGEVYLKQILAKILGENDRESHYRNILHTLKSLTYQKIIFSNKIACENGLLDVETREFKQFTLAEMAFYSIPTNYDPKAECPNWLEFLKQVLNPEDTPTLQEWSGYLLLPDYRFHKLMWLHGEGRNGKGTWQRTIEAILGEDNVSGVGLEEFDGNHRFAMQKLYGKLFNPCSEPATNRILQTSLLKKATGQDTIDAEVKGSNNRIKFRNAAKITVIANKFPKVNDTTTAFRERRLFITFPFEFIGKDQIADLENLWLKNPEECSGILNWMLQGLHRLLSNGMFTESKTQQETEIAFQRTSDTIGAFQLEMGIFDKNLVITRSDAFNAYKEYCEFIGVEPENDKIFTQRMKTTAKVKEGTTTVKGSRLRAWLGFGVKTFDKDGTVSDVSDVSCGNTLDNFQNNQKIRQISERDTSDTNDTPYNPEKSAIGNKRECGKCTKFRKATYPACSFPHGITANGPHCEFAENCPDFESVEEVS